MQFVEVKDKSSIKEFLEFPVRLYKGEKHWIRPLDQDVEAVFDKEKNKFFRHGECIRWILQNDKKETVGRVAAFINRKSEKSKNKEGQELHTGGMGFFESIEDEKVAFMLFDKAKEWLSQNGMNSMDGPINFGERDQWWGLLVDGFDIDPNYCMPYTKPYYIPFFENYGFQVYFKQYTYGRGVNDEMQERYWVKAERIMQNPDYTFERLKMSELNKYAEYFKDIYNKAWVKHAGVKGMSTLQAQTIMKQMKPIVDPDIVYFAFYQGEPVAFFINLPEVNQIFKHLNGKLGWIQKAMFLYHKLMRTNKKMVGRAFGVVPEHQGKGIESAIVMFCRKIVQEEIRGRYIEYEMNWIGDFNPKMMRVAETIGHIIKTHHTYRYMFDKELVFERCPEIR